MLVSLEANLPRSLVLRESELEPVVQAPYTPESVWELAVQTLYTPERTDLLRRLPHEQGDLILIPASY